MKTPKILLIIVCVLLASIIVSAIVFSNVVTQETDVGDTPLNISIEEIDLVGYPHPLGGTITEDFRHFPDYVVIGELVDEKISITPTATCNATLYLTIESSNLDPRAWLWDGTWNELQFTTDSGTATAVVFDGQFIATKEIPIVLQFNEGGHKSLMWWCEG